MEGFFSDIYTSIQAWLPKGFRPYLDPVLIVLAAMLCGMLARLLIFNRLYKYSATTPNPYDDIVFEWIRKRTVLWITLIAVVLCLPLLPWSKASIAIAETVVLAFLVLSFTLTLVRMYSGIVRKYGQVSGTGVGGTSLIKYLGSFVFYVAGIIIVLTLFEVSILPAITALGVGGLAVALAFQETLANIFAGIYITLSQQLRVGDFVEMENGRAGFVHDISWRTTTLRSFENNLIIVPNKKLADAIVINYHLPEPKVMVELAFGVSYLCDPYELEEILIDEFQKAREELPGFTEDDPITRFKAYGDSALQFKFLLFVNDFSLKFQTAHDMMKRLYRRFKQEGIEIPYPIRTLHFPDGGLPLTTVQAPTNDQFTTLSKEHEGDHEEDAEKTKTKDEQDAGG